MFDSIFLNLSPKFYVALTGTSSLISGLILIFEWYYFKKYGISFIEQISLNHISPFLSSTESPQSTDQNGQFELKVWRNPFNLFRGSEYQRYFWATAKEPLTYYDMNLSAQDHQTFFTCTIDSGKSDYEMMMHAYRERNPVSRIKSAHKALEINPENSCAYIILAEEEATTIVEAELILKQALKVAEINYKKSQGLQGALYEAAHRRDANIIIYIKRRLAMCARKLGKLKEAAKIFRDLTKEPPSSIISVLNVHENLLECLLEMKAYADCSAVLAKYDDISLPKSAAICYTSALLKARVVSEKFQPDVASRRGLTTAELQAIEAIHRAVEFNPHVPKYLLEMKKLIFPAEHILKRGDSEALAYAFFNLRHWKNVSGALNLLQNTWEGTFRLIPYPLQKGHLFFPYPQMCTECADRELLPSFHELSIYPKKEVPFFILFTAGLCSCTALLALLTHSYPDVMYIFAQTILNFVLTPFRFLKEMINY